MSAVVPPDFVAEFASNPASSNARRSAGVPNRIFSAQGSIAPGSASRNAGVSTFRAGPKARASAITAQLAPIAEMN